jgi:hypothetical protein
MYTSYILYAPVPSLVLVGQSSWLLYLVLPLFLSNLSKILYCQDVSSRFLQNSENHLQDNKLSQHRRRLTIWTRTALKISNPIYKILHTTIMNTELGQVSIYMLSIYMTRTGSPDTSAPWGRGQRWSLTCWFFHRLTNWNAW